MTKTELIAWIAQHCSRPVTKDAEYVVTLIPLQQLLHGLQNRDGSGESEGQEGIKEFSYRALGPQQSMSLIPHRCAHGGRRQVEETPHEFVRVLR